MVELLETLCYSFWELIVWGRGMMKSVSGIIEKMIEYSEGNLHDISHFMKVWAFAKTIGELEQLDEKTQLILEVAAVTHDIACPLCREKYVSTDGKLQEKEGAELVLRFLEGSGLTEGETERVSFLVGHHHTYTGIDNADYQILLEADYLVNAEESKYPTESIKNALKNIFRTKSGIHLLKEMYLRGA